MKKVDFLLQATERLPQLEVENKYQNITLTLDANWRQQITYLPLSNTNQTPVVEVITTYYPNGVGKKSTIMNWSIFARKHKGEEWNLSEPFKTWK